MCAPMTRRRLDRIAERGTSAVTPRGEPSRTRRPPGLAASTASRRASGSPVASMTTGARKCRYLLRVSVRHEKTSPSCRRDPLLGARPGDHRCLPAPAAFARRCDRRPISPAPITQTASPLSMPARRTPCPQMTPNCTIAAASSPTPAGTGCTELAGAVTTDMCGTFLTATKSSRLDARDVPTRCEHPSGSRVAGSMREPNSWYWAGSDTARAPSRC